MNKALTILTAVVFFSLGILFYFVFPRDASIQVPDSAPRSVPGIRVVQDDENKCATYEQYLMVDGKMLEGPITVKCQ